MNNNLTEVVARAIATQKRDRLTVETGIVDKVWPSYCGQARAAIEAVLDWLEEPSGNVLQAGADKLPDGYHVDANGYAVARGDAAELWEVMLARLRAEALP